MTEFFWGCVGVAIVIFAILAGLALMIKAASFKRDEWIRNIYMRYNEPQKAVRKRKEKVMSAIDKVKEAKESIKDKKIEPIKIVKTGLSVVGGVAIIGGVAYLIGKNVHVAKAADILDQAPEAVANVAEVAEAAL